MVEPIRIAVLGTGQMGAGIARLVLDKPGMSLVGAYARRPERVGADLARVVGLERDPGLAIHGDLAQMVRDGRPQVAIQATCSRLDEALPEIAVLLQHGVNVISIAEQMAWPAATSPAAARQLHRLAAAHGVSVVGTGINPGFVLDLLVIALSGVCLDVASISATRVNDLSPYGRTVLDSQGVGLTPEQFRRGLEEGVVVGHYGFTESIHMIAAALGWEIEHIEQTREPIIATVPRETPRVRVDPGAVAGCHHRAVAYRDGRPVITLDHPQQVAPEAEGTVTGDCIEIRGTPDVRFAGSPEIPGGQGTIALAVNMVPRVLAAAPGLYTMADLPVPAAIPGEARRGSRESAGS